MTSRGNQKSLLAFLLKELFTIFTQEHNTASIYNDFFDVNQFGVV